MNFTGGYSELYGALYIENPTRQTNITITDSIFDSNVANSGGAIYASIDKLILNNVNFTKNRANNAGGAIATM